MPLQATSGAASYDAFGGGAAAVPTYIEDVFSTYLYTGTGATQTITNGIDLSGKGGLVWTKSRSNVYNNALVDTVRGGSSVLVSNNTDAASTSAARLSFGSTGYDVLSTSGTLWNGSGSTYASWTFREQAKFFDVVTWSGNSTAGRTIPHNLGSVPGCIIVKCTSNITDWAVYHRSLSSAANALQLNTSGAQITQTGYWNSTAPTSSVFTVGADNDVNATGRTYVAYLFAHDAGGFGLTGADNVISCGSFTTDGSGNATVTLGYEPQFVIWKKSSAAGAWNMQDVMRGMPVSGDGQFLEANASDAEYGASQPIRPSATGFYGALAANANSTYIYIAIRRGPMKTPTSGTSVFAPVARTGTGAAATVTTNFAPDFIISHARNAVYSTGVWDRLRGVTKYLETTGTAAEATSSDSVTLLPNTAYVLGLDSATDRINRSGDTYANWAFGRAPGFFDEVCYTGNGTSQNINHSLSVVPELMLVKRRSTARGWAVYYGDNGKAMTLNDTTASRSFAGWNYTTPTASVFSLGTDSDVNAASETYVTYLFATCPGVSKVGSFTGTGSTLQINCGFTGGARFVLIKRTDSTGDWYVWDSARGIVAGNDPYLLLNSTAAEVTTTDWVDTYSAGFELSNAGGNNVNISTATYIFWAIA